MSIYIESCWIPIFFFNSLIKKGLCVANITASKRNLISGCALNEISDNLFVCFSKLNNLL